MQQLLVRLSDRIDKAVMRQFIPLRAIAEFAADQVQFIQRVDGVVAQAFGLRLTPEHHATRSSGSDQLLFEPGPQRRLWNVGLLRYLFDRVFIKTQQRLFHVGRREVSKCDLCVLGLQIAPEAFAHDLKHDRLDKLAGDRFCLAAGCFHLRFHKLFHQLLGDILREVAVLISR